MVDSIEHEYNHKLLAASSSGKYKDVIKKENDWKNRKEALEIAIKVLSGKEINA